MDRCEQTIVVTVAHGTEHWAAQEALEHGATSVRLLPGAVQGQAPLATAYRLCLWSRVAHRVLLPIHTGPAAHAAALYETARAVPWYEHFHPRSTFAVEATGSRSATLRHSHFVAQKVKDAVVDQFRERWGARPSVDPHHPDFVIHVHVQDNEATLAIDLSGPPLYQRGYRTHAGRAPLRETLAAALLYQANWPQRSAAGDTLLDPFCGTGTIPIEGAWIAHGIAPGLLRTRFGFLAWGGHNAELWRQLRSEAIDQIRRGGPKPRIYASDSDLRALRAAQQNAGRAGVEAAIHFERMRAELRPPPAGAPGLIVTNPPYGERLGGGAVTALYARFGDHLRKEFLGWTAWLLTANTIAAKSIGLRSKRRIPLWNGPLECRLLCFPISETPTKSSAPPRWRARSGRYVTLTQPGPFTRSLRLGRTRS